MYAYKKCVRWNQRTPWSTMENDLLGHNVPNKKVVIASIQRDALLSTRKAETNNPNSKICFHLFMYEQMQLRCDW